MNPPVRWGERVLPFPECPGFGPTRADLTPAARSEMPGGSCSSRASGRRNAAALCGAFHGGGRIGGSSAPESPGSSPSSRPERTSSSGSVNPRARPDGLAGARAGAVVGSPKCRRILPTTAGSVRNASTWDTRAHLMWRTRRDSCAQGIRRRGAPDGGSLDRLASVSPGLRIPFLRSVGKGSYAAGPPFRPRPPGAAPSHFLEPHPRDRVESPLRDEKKDRKAVIIMIRSRARKDRDPKREGDPGAGAFRRRSPPPSTGGLFCSCMRSSSSRVRPPSSIRSSG